MDDFHRAEKWTAEWWFAWMNYYGAKLWYWVMHGAA
jgi:hypothetical protein